MRGSRFNNEIPCPELAQFIGNRIRVARKAKGLSQARLSEMIGAKSAATVNRFENGERPPSIEQLLDLHAAINLDLSKMFRELTTTGASLDQSEIRIERELLLHLIKERAEDVRDPVLSQLITNSLHLLDSDTLKVMLEEMRKNRSQVAE